jgi:D-sedoheptulose 7-phosphate isomerase
MTDFLYPFIDGHAGSTGALLDDLAASAAAKIDASTALRAATINELAATLDAAATAIAQRLGAGGRLFAFGNGGSATDAAATVALFSEPPWGQPLAARSLVADPAVITALANDVGFELVFARQLIAEARGGDVAVGLSTSGASANVLRGLEQARRIGALTIGVAGYDGGAMAQSGTLDHCLVVRSDSVHRIQETQSSLIYDLWQRVQRGLAGKSA